MVTKPETSTKGFALLVRRTCIAGHEFKWNSQPSIKGSAACNVLVPAAIFITGNSYSSFMELCDAMNLQALSTRHCYSVQRRFIIPEVEEMWHLHDTVVFYGGPLFMMRSIFSSYEAHRLNIVWNWILLRCWTCAPLRCRAKSSPSTAAYSRPCCSSGASFFPTRMWWKADLNL